MNHVAQASPDMSGLYRPERSGFCSPPAESFDLSTLIQWFLERTGLTVHPQRLVCLWGTHILPYSQVSEFPKCMDGKASDTHEQPTAWVGRTANVFGLNQQIIGAALFVGVVLLFNWNSTLLLGPDDPWRTVAKERSYHWAVIPLALLAVVGAAVAVLPNRKADQGATASRFAETLVWGLAAYPFALIAWFYLYVLRQRVVLGYWPRPCHPDPKDAGMNFHHDSLPFMFELVPIAALGAISLIVALRNCDPNFRWRRPQALWVVALGILIALVQFDPGYFIEWWAD